jgi:hypothetical protein
MPLEADPTAGGALKALQGGNFFDKFLNNHLKTKAPTPAGARFS